MLCGRRSGVKLRASGSRSRGGTSVRSSVGCAITNHGRTLEPILVHMQSWGCAFKERMRAEEAATS